MEKQRNDFVVFSPIVANQLIERGFNMLGTGINSKNPRYRVYFFPATKEVKHAVKEITTQLKQGELPYSNKTP